jgi:iron complex outermembrane receptor protein
MLKANIGQELSCTDTKELGSDGVNYHIFRYEKGNNSLKAEESYQADMGISWQNNLLTVRLEPFLNYFPNISTESHAEYYEGLQMYHYAQARVIRYGFETAVQLQLTRQITLGIQSEYLYAEQLSGDKKGIPFLFRRSLVSNFSIGYRPAKDFSAPTVTYC